MATKNAETALGRYHPLRKLSAYLHRKRVFYASVVPLGMDGEHAEDAIEDFLDGINCEAFDEGVFNFLSRLANIGDELVMVYLCDAPLRPGMEPVEVPDVFLAWLDGLIENSPSQANDSANDFLDGKWKEMFAA